MKIYRGKIGEHEKHILLFRCWYFIYVINRAVLTSNTFIQRSNKFD